MGLYLNFQQGVEEEKEEKEVEKEEESETGSGGGAEAATPPVSDAATGSAETGGATGSR